MMKKQPNKGRALSMKSASASGVMCLLAGLSAGQVAHAEADVVPLYLTMTQQIEHDNNVLRNNAEKVSAVVSSTQARLGLDKTYGRQHYTLDATVAKNKYSRSGDPDIGRFDNDSHTATGGFTTDIASDFRFNVNGKSTRSLPSFENSTESQRVRNVLRTKVYGADIRYGLYGRMSVNTGFSKSSYKYDETDYDNRDATSAFVGFRYLPNDLMYFGVTYTNTKSEYALREFEYELTPGNFVNKTGEEVNSDNVSLNANWQVTGFSVFSGSIGYSKESYKFDKRRNFNGVTGSAAWRFTPAGKVSYRLAWSRDTNNSGSGSFAGVTLGTKGFQYNEGYFAQNKVTNTYSASASFEATSKISFNAGYTYISSQEERLTVNNQVETGGSQNGRYSGYSLGGDYQPIDSVGLGCNAQFYDRTRSLFQNAFDGRSLSCYASFTLQ